LCEDQEKFESDKQFFAEQRATLENERRQLTDAAVKLGHEVGNINITKQSNISGEKMSTEEKFSVIITSHGP